MLHRPLARAARALAAVLVVLLLAPGPSLAVGAPAPKQDAGGASARGRVLVVGFDGADWRTTERLMDEGLLPNLAKLRESGSAGPLVSTEPAESAAGWAAINTG
ncbi:MAG: alkaline phosphatase family protein, partial [Planctomycetota bacterium]